MSYFIAVPDELALAATELDSIGTTLSAANVAAVLPTTGIPAAGADDVSMAIAALFAGHAQAYQALSTAASTFHTQFVRALNLSGGAYAAADAANASPLQTLEQDLLGVLNAPTQALLGRPLIGAGADGTAPGQGGGAGGLLYGNGG
ncbi:PE family protein, partial [Mycobacterium marinum]